MKQIRECKANTETKIRKILDKPGDAKIRMKTGTILRKGEYLYIIKIDGTIKYLSEGKVKEIKC